MDYPDLPAFLMISRERRAQAWRDYSARQDLGPRRAELDAKVWDTPGAVARRFGYWNPRDESAIADLRERDALRAAAKEFLSKARLYAKDERERKAREEMRKVKETAKRNHAAF